MKRIILLSLLSALLAGCVVVPLGYDDGYRGHGYYRGDGYYHGYYGYRGYGYNNYRDHGQ